MIILSVHCDDNHRIAAPFARISVSVLFTERDGEKRKKERERVCVCVCVRVCDKRIVALLVQFTAAISMLLFAASIPYLD